jgi:hypothetical protein
MIFQFLLFSLFINANTALHTPPYYIANYKLTRAGIEFAKTQRCLYPNEYNSQQTIFHSVSYTSGLLSHFRPTQIDERSLFKAQDNSLQPLYYSYKKKSKNNQRNVSLQFNWSKHTIKHKINKSRWTLHYGKADTQDKLLVFLTLSYQLIAHPQKKYFSYPVADGGFLKTYNFTVLGEEKLKTALGTINTIKIQQRRLPKNELFFLWYAKDLDYLPVRVEQKKGEDKQLTMQIIDYNRSINIKQEFTQYCHH